MQDTRTRLLIVDDEPSIRTSMSHVLIEVGYSVRSAEDGFSALQELRKEIPDILLSDLNMPGMSGFELLSVVRRRFPSIQAIAMSGAFSGEEVPSGVAADAFYQKGSSMGALLQILGTLPQTERRAARLASAAAPIWIRPNDPDSSGIACVTIACPECLRSFNQPLGSSLCEIRQADCIFCHSPIHYAIVPPVERAQLQMFLSLQRESMVPRASQFYY